MSQTIAPQQSLRDLQRWMRWVLTDPRGVARAVSEPVPSDVQYPERYSAPKPDCLNLIVEDARLPRIERLDVYAEGYFSRIVEVFESDFRAIKHVVGHNFFLRIVADYLKAYPSTVTNINEIGLNFGNFLRHYELSQEIDYLPELADLEWAVTESFYADNIPTLAPETLNAIPADAWPNARFTLDPSIRLLETKWPVDLLWKQREDECSCAESADSSELLEPIEPSHSYFLLYRPTTAVEINSISAEEFRALCQLKAGLTLGEVCENMEEDASLTTTGITTWFSQWMSRGLLRGITFKETS